MFKININLTYKVLLFLNFLYTYPITLHSFSCLFMLYRNENMWGHKNALFLKGFVKLQNYKKAEWDLSNSTVEGGSKFTRNRSFSRFAPLDRTHKILVSNNEYMFVICQISSTIDTKTWENSRPSTICLKTLWPTTCFLFTRNMSIDI